MIVINLFGEPGAGKSTGAAYIFAMLKMNGVNAELVTEYAKDITWEETKEAFKNQAYLFGQQAFRLSRCADKVDVIVTDSPLPLSIVYNNNENLTQNFTNTVMDVFNSYENINYLILRRKPYNPIGRNQNEEEAQVLKEKIYRLLSENKIDHSLVFGSLEGYNHIVEEVLSILEEQNNS